MAKKKTKKNNGLKSSATPVVAASPTASASNPPSSPVAARCAARTASSVVAGPHGATGHGTVNTSTCVLSVLLALVVGVFAGTLLPGVLTRPETEIATRQSVPQTAQQPGAQLSAEPESRMSDTVRGRILELERHVQHQADDVDAWIQLGNLYFDVSNPPNAIRAYERALLLTPDNPDVLTDLGIMYRETGKFEMAEQSFRKAAQINPRHQNALFNRGVVLFFDLGRKDDARTIWRQLLAVNPDAKAPDGRVVRDMVETLK